MRVENKKSVLVVILILLIPSLVLGGWGLALNYLNKDEPQEMPFPDNPDKDFKFQGYLYFYSNNELLGAYECVNIDACDYALEYIDDDEYALDYYEDNEINKIELINNRYVFLVDSAAESVEQDVILYDIINNKKIAIYRRVKNYTIGLESNRFIVQSTNESWGVIELDSEVPSSIVSFDYDFVGVINSVVNNKLSATTFVVKEENSWGLVNSKGEYITEKLIDQIKSYNEESIIIKSNSSYYLYDYKGAMQLNGFSYKDLSFVDKYLAILDYNNNFYVYDLNLNVEVTMKHQVPSGSTYEALMSESGLQIIIGNNIYPYSNLT